MADYGKCGGTLNRSRGKTQFSQRRTWIETDTGVQIGDGVTPWNNLPTYRPETWLIGVKWAYGNIPTPRINEFDEKFAGAAFFINYPIQSEGNVILRNDAWFGDGICLRQATGR